MISEKLGRNPELLNLHVKCVYTISMNIEKYGDCYRELRATGSGMLLSTFVALRSFDVLPTQADSNVSEIFRNAGITSEVINPAHIVVAGLH